MPELLQLPPKDIKLPALRARQEPLDSDRLNDLAESFKLVGQLQPIGVRKTQAGYVLIFGGYRLKAAEKLGWLTIEAKVFNAIEDDVQAMVVNAAENIHHKNQSIAENMAVVQYLKEQNELADETIARSLSLSRAWVEGHLEVIRNPELRAIAQLGFLKDAHDVKAFKSSPPHIRSLFLTN